MGRIAIVGSILIVFGVYIGANFFTPTQSIEKACKEGAFSRFTDRLPEHLTQQYCTCLLDLTPVTTDYERRSIPCYFIIRQAFNVPFDWQKEN